MSLQLAGLRRRLGAMKDFRQTSGAYRESLAVRRDRLGVAKWIGELFVERHECPLCGTTDRPAEAAVRRLQGALQDVEAQTDAFERMPAAFDREYVRVQADVDRATERLNGIRLRLRALQATSEGARRRQYDLTAAARFLGHLEDALERYDQLATDGALTAEVVALRERLDDVEARLRQLGGAAALRRAGSRFTALASRIIPGLDAERPDDPIELDVSELTLRVVGEDREDYLWEVGSGANWLSYHVATSVALHELFLAQPASPVPSFVVFDQPSQVYFPRSATGDAVEGDARPDEAAAPPAAPSDGAEASAPSAGAPAILRPGLDSSSSERPGASSGEPAPGRIADEDVEAVRRVFSTLADAARRLRGEWQAIVLDHAHDEVWGTVDGAHFVEEWRGGVKLVPEQWVLGTT